MKSITMAEKLLKYYDDAKKLGGLKAQMRLALITKVPSAKAVSAPDSSDNIQSFEKAMMEIKKEFM